MKSKKSYQSDYEDNLGREDELMDEDGVVKDQRG
jgi:hypothetical protein